MRAEDILPGMLEMAVSMRIEEYLAKGGPDDADRQRVSASGETLAERGDRLLYPSEVPGETARLFNQLADAIAVLSFQSQGITAFGGHWKSSRKSMRGPRDPQEPGQSESGS